MVRGMDRLRAHWTGRSKALTLLLALTMAGAMALKMREGSRGAEAMLDNVVVIEEANGRLYGAGFVMQGGGYVLTVNHVIEDMVKGHRPIWIRYRDGYRVQAGLVKRNRHFDIALLILPNRHVRGLEIMRDSYAHVGDPVYAIGHPYGIVWMMTEGIVSKKSYFPPDENGESFVIWTSAWIEGGDSGGPLVTKSGKVIGLIQAFINPRGTQLGAQHLNICVSSSEIMRFLEAD